LSTDTHAGTVDTVKHDTELIATVSTPETDHDVDPPVGSVDVTTFPVRSTATHKLELVHEMEFNMFGSIAVGADQELPL
jgi:hypothetical protein